MSNLFRQVTYLTSETAIGGTYIREYDISKANINILLYKGLITRERYKYLYSLPKKLREVLVGVMQRNKKYLIAIQEGILEFKERFFKSNRIKDDDVVAIKNDAIFIKDVVPKYTKFFNIEFKLKNIYTTFMNVNGIEIYYNSNTGKMDLKGLGEDRIELHKSMLESIKIIVDFASLNAFDDCFYYLKDIYRKLCNKELPVDYYREFNPRSEFLIDSRHTMMGYSLQYNYLPESYKKYLNIATNEKFFRELSLACVRLFFKTSPHRT